MRSIEVFCSEHGISPATPEAIARAIESEEFRNLWCSFKQEAPLRGESWHAADRSVGIMRGFFEEMAVVRGGPKWATEVLTELSADAYQELLEEEMDTLLENAR